MTDTPLGVQHTRCLLALTLLRTCLDLLTIPPDDQVGFAKYVEEIRSGIKTCSDALKVKRLSAGAKRDLDRSFNVLARYMGNSAISERERFRQWGSVFLAASFFLEDALTTARSYTAPIEWKILRRNVNLMRDVLIELEPHIDEEGSAIYEEAYAV